MEVIVRFALYISAAILFLTGCAVPQDPLPNTIVQPELSAPSPASPSQLEATITPTGDTPTETNPTSPASIPQLTITPVGPDQEAIVQKATEMLADKLGIDPDVIELFTVQAVDWPDESLGCPLGGQNYAQVITPGFLIELEVDNAIYDFHTDKNGRVLLCGLAPTREIYQPP